VCFQYWPSSGTQKCGEFKVEFLGEERLQGFVLRTFNIQYSKVSSYLICCYNEWIVFFLQSSNHHVSQFHITNWAPDGSCSNLKTVIDVIEEVSKVQRRTGNQPIVIHCRYAVATFYLLVVCL